MANESVVNSARILVFKALLCPKVAEILGNNLTVTRFCFPCTMSMWTQTPGDPAAWLPFLWCCPSPSPELPFPPRALSGGGGRPNCHSSDFLNHCPGTAAPGFARFLFFNMSLSKFLSVVLPAPSPTNLAFYCVILCSMFLFGSTYVVLQQK